MPIDPNIPLQFKPTTPLEDPATQISKALTVRNQVQQGQVNAQQLQEGALGLQEKQRQVNEGQQLRDLFAQPGMDMQTALPHVFAINPTTGLALQKGMHEAQKAALDTQKTQIEVNAKKAERFGAIAGTITDEPSFHAGIATAAGEGLIDGAGAQGLLAQGWNPDTQKQVASIVQGSMDAKTQADQARAALDEKRKQLTADQATELQKYNVTKAAGEAASATVDPVTKLKPNETREAAQAKVTADATAARDANTVTNDAELRRQGKVRVNTEAAAQALRQKTYDNTIGAGRDVNGQPLKDPTTGKPLTGDPFLATLPAGRAAQVKAFAEGRLTDADLPRGKEKQPFMDSVMQYDPAYTKQSAETRKAFGPAGKIGQNNSANNTAVVHLDQLGEAAMAMHNGTFTPGNAVVNNLVTMFGGAAPTSFEGLRAAVASEMATALKGNATDPEIAAMNHTISTAGSPKALAGIITTNLHTLGAKLNTRDEEYHRAIPSDTSYTPVLPTAQAVFDKHGIQPIQRLAVKPQAAAAAQGGYIVGRKYGTLTYQGGDPAVATSFK